MTTKVTLEISVPSDPDGERPGDIALRLVDLGGRLTGWRPEVGGAPARAHFEFETEAQCEWFVTVALGIPGVSLSTAAATTG